MKDDESESPNEELIQHNMNFNLKMLKHYTKHIDQSINTKDNMLVNLDK